MNLRLRARIAGTTALSLALGLLTFSAQAQQTKSVEPNSARQVAPAFVSPAPSPADQVKAVDDSATVNRASVDLVSPIDVLSNDISTASGSPILDASTLKLCDPSVAPTCASVTFIEVPKQGKFTVDATTPSAPVIKFQPCSALDTPFTGCTGEFTGVVNEQRYVVLDNAGIPGSYIAKLNISVSPTFTCKITPAAFKGIKNTERQINVSQYLSCPETAFVSGNPLFESAFTYKISLASDSTGVGVKYKNTATTPVTTTLSKDTELDITDLTKIKLIAPLPIAADTTYKIQIRAKATKGSTFGEAIFTFTYFVPATTPAAPSCTKISAGTTVNRSVDINLQDDYATLGYGCKGGIGASLSYVISKAYKGTATVTNQLATFTPQANWVSPQGWTDATVNTRRAWFTFYAVDDYGQRSIASTTDDDYRVYIQVSANAACSAPLKNQVLFNSPTGVDAIQFKITNQILGYIDCAGPSSVITMSWFSLTDYDFVAHLKAAKKRGANVRFLINSHATKPASSSFGTWNALKLALGTTPANGSRNGSNHIDSAGGSWAMYCNSGCLTPKPKPGVVFPADSEGEYPALHSKFFMISNIRGKSVVGIASSNPTVAQSVNGWNNAQFIVETAGAKNNVFANLNRYFAKLSAMGCTNTNKCPAKPRNPDSYQKLATLGDTSLITFPHPGSGLATDDIAVELTDLLKNKKCVKNVGGTKVRTQIYVNMFVFTRNSLAILLWKLANNRPADGGGCQVHLIYTDMDQAIKDRGKWLNNKDGGVNWGALDCISTPATTNGKFRALTTPSRRYLRDANDNLVRDKKGKIRYVNVNVCSRGVLQGRMATINYGGGYCWFKSSSKVSGGSTDLCVSSPMSLTGMDPADNRTKLEPIQDSKGLNRYSHQKYMLIQSFDVSGKKTYKTFAGTPNFTSPGLRWNDEILIVSTNKDTFQQYLANFNAMKSWIKGRAGSSIGNRNCGYYTKC